MADRLKYLIVASFYLVPAAILLKSDTADMRSCINTYLGGLCKKDDNSNILLKEVPNEDIGGITPLSSSSSVDTPGEPVRKVLVHDESLDVFDCKAFHNALNGACKVINHGSIEILAFTKNPNVITPHKLNKDSSGNVIHRNSAWLSLVTRPVMTVLGCILLARPMNPKLKELYLNSAKNLLC